MGTKRIIRKLPLFSQVVPVLGQIHLMGKSILQPCLLIHVPMLEDPTVITRMNSSDNSEET